MKRAANTKHIVIDARSSGTSTGRYVEKLVQSLPAIDNEHHYTVLVWPRFLKTAPVLPTNFTYQAADYPLNGSASEQTGLLRDIRRLQPDLVHFTMAQQPLLYRGKTVTTLQDLTGIRFRNPLMHPLVFKVKRSVFAQLNKRVARKSAAVLTPTEFVKDDIVAFTGISPDKVTVTYESADQITVAPAPLPDLQNKQFIMYVGRPTPHKNLGRLVEAFALLHERHPDLLLVLAGKKDANYERLEATIDQTLKPAVHFTGFVSEGGLRWLYESTAAYIFPSLSEGFGLPGLEAMVHGAPVVSSNATCLPEVYGDAAQYFDPLDVPAMAEAIDEVLADKAFRTELIRKGHEQAARYSWRRMAEQTLAVYQHVLR